jgi:hypothetical protein
VCDQIQFAGIHGSVVEVWDHICSYSTSHHSAACQEPCGWWIRP